MLGTICFYCSLQLLISFLTKRLYVLNFDLYMSKTIFSWQLELKLGLGGTSYEDFIRNMHLPMQLRLLLKLYFSLFPNSKYEASVTFFC